MPQLSFGKRFVKASGVALQSGHPTKVHAAKAMVPDSYIIYCTIPGHFVCGMWALTTETEQPRMPLPPFVAGGGQAILAASIRRRISSMAGPRPTNTDSPIRKCPMFSSRTSGIAAIGVTLP